MKHVLSVAVAALAIGAVPAALAQAWPAKPVRIMVPFAPGSFTEVAARAVGAELAEQLGQPFVIENRGGAGATLGTDAVAKSAPDGYQLLFTDNSFVIAPGLYPKLPYDAAKDIVQISIAADAPAMITAKLDLPAATLREFVELAKAKPATLTFGSGGQGSSAHLGMELFQSAAGIRLVHVPFKGVGPALQETAAGRIDVTLSSVGTASPHIKAGRAKALAVAGRERNALLPDVPTMAEAGLPGFDMVYWFGFMAPAGTPPAIVERLHAEIARAVQKQKVKDVFAAQGVRAISSTPDEYARRVQAETRMWRETITRAGVKVE
jgi:tripartite-type tricarboxylate transporter receptor subunit TctC